MKTISASITRSYEERYNYLDAARAFALLLGIIFHGVCFMVSYLGPAFWAVKNDQSNIVTDLFFFLSHTFRMQAFFLISGFFAHMVLHSKGMAGFLMHRARRITLPLLIFWPVIFLLIDLLWIWGFQRMGYFKYNHSTADLTYLQIFIGNFATGRWLNEGFPLTHLWFLYILTWFFISAFIVRFLLENMLDRNNRIRVFTDKCIDFLMSQKWGSMIFAVLTLPAMWKMKSGFGVDTPEHGFLPNAASFIVFGGYFLLGWFLHRNSYLMDYFKKYWKFNLGLCLIFMSVVSSYFMFGAKLTIIQTLLKNPVASKELSLLFNSIYGLASMTSVFAFIGVVMAFFEKQSKFIRYLSDSSYWLYIVHLPIVVFFQILIVPLHVFWVLKLVMILVPSFIIMLLTYHYLVRGTWLGLLLNGKKIMVRNVRTVVPVMQV